MKSKFQQWKEAVKNTPPEELLKINMQGYILQSIGLLVVCILLIIQKDWWWLIFAFIFSLWNNVSGFISNWKQRSEILEIKTMIGEDRYSKSPTIGKARLIKSQLGRVYGWSCMGISFIAGSFIFNLGHWYFRTLSALIVIFIYYLLFFKLGYFLARKKREHGKQ